MNCFRRICLTLALILLLSIGRNAGAAAPRYSGTSPRSGQPPVILCDEANPPLTVFFPANASAQERLAAKQLAKYLGQMAETVFPVKQAAEPLPERAVLVGEFSTAPPDSLSREGFIIQSEGGRLLLQGGSPRATLYAVFCLLEEQLGCRWWSHNEEFVPKDKTLRIIAQDTHIEPAFIIHDLFNKEGQSAANQFVFKRRGASGRSFTAVHNLCPMLKPHVEAHPEFLPTDKDGNRKFNNIHMNYTAPGMAEVVAESLSREVARRKGNLQDYYYFAGMGDWYGGMDYSPPSRKIYEEEAWVDPDGRKKPGYCATMLRMVNRAAELLEQKHPGAVVATHAYMSLEAPPAKTRPRDNVIVEIPRLRHDTVRSIVESDKNQSFRRNLDRWCELAPGRVYIWEYGANFNNFLKPFPCIRSLAANLQYYEQAGVAGVRIQGNYVSMGGDLAVLKNYVWGKLLWDPTRDVDALLHEFCHGYYGPAGDELLAYVNLLEASVRGDAPVSADEFEKDFTKWLRPEVVANAKTRLDQALAKTAADTSQPYHRRVKEAQVSLEAFQLWQPAEFVEQGEQLVRKDVGASTLQRARELVANCRQASPREWGDGRAYRMGFLAMQGGPLPILHRGPVEAKVAPLLDGRIRGVAFDGTMALDQSRHVLEPGARIYELTDDSDHAMTMEADLGVAHWGSNTKQFASQTIRLREDGVLETLGTLRLATGSRQKSNQPRIESIYRCGNSPGDVQIEFRDESGAWQLVSLTPDQPNGLLLAASELRITRRDRGLVILDRYLAPNGSTPSGKAEFVAAKPPEESHIRITVDLPQVMLTSEKPTRYLLREIRVTRKENTP